MAYENCSLPFVGAQHGVVQQIHLLPALSHLFWISSKKESRVIYRSIIEYLEKYKLINEKETIEFWQKRSTADLISYVTHLRHKSLQHKVIEKTWSSALLSKLSSYCLNPRNCFWITSFLSVWLIAVAVDGHKSNFHSVNVGVSQGSVQDPTLFLLPMNDTLYSTFIHFNSPNNCTLRLVTRK